jgi:hypothetical protein
MDQSSRPARKVGIADHIWNAFEEMAGSMGSDRDALINQAMFMFARLNGFMDSHADATPSNGAGKTAGPGAIPVEPPLLSPVSSPPRIPSTPSHMMDDDPARREVAERVLETAAELERLIKGKNQPAESDVGVDLDDGPQRSEGVSSKQESGQLYLMSESGEWFHVGKERFIIGRGKHCDFVINSGKVSREHAAIVREGADYMIQDLGSSNGTWFNKQRIKHRKIDDGDEYFICSEKVKLVFR